MQMNRWRRPAFARARGLDHILNGTECQDFVDVVDRPEFTIAVLADGIGSKALSQYAAHEAVKGTVHWLMSREKSFGNMENPEEGFQEIRMLLPELRCRIRNMAEEKNLDVKQMDCNLAFVFLRKDPGGEDRVYIGVLGDCAVCVIYGEDRMETLCGAPEGGLATDSVMYPGSDANFQIYHSYVKRDDIRGFLLTTDGLEYVAYVKRSGYVYKGAQEYYNAIFSEDPEQRINSLFRKLQENSSFSDDLSVAVLSRDAGPRTFRKDPYWLCKCGHKNAIYAIRCSNCNKDYLEMYGDLEKYIKKHGCKDAFEYFLYLNQNPDQERLQLGQAPTNLGRENKKVVDPPVVSVGAAEKNVKEKPPVAPKTEVQAPEQQIKAATNSHEERDRKKTGPRRRNFSRFLGYAALIALLLANLTFSAINMRSVSEIRAMGKELKAQLLEIQITMKNISDHQETAGVPQEQETYCIELEDGSVYYGPVRNGIPHGYGMVQMEDCIAYGEMINGKKIGTFWIRSNEDPDVLSVVTYDSNEKAGEEVFVGSINGRANVLTGCLINAKTNAYKECDQKSEVLEVFAEDTLIYLTGQYNIVSKPGRDKAELWLEVCTVDGMLFWCRASELEMYQP